MKSESSEKRLRVVRIIEGTSVDGPGLRTSIYLAGCRHHCPECHNPQTWDFAAGSDLSVDDIMAIVRHADFDVTLSGGDPIEQAEALLPLVKAIHAENHSVWLYTGYTYEQLQTMPHACALFPYLEAIVDGPFVRELKDISLPFRGSSNQRIIYLNAED